MADKANNVWATGRNAANGADINVWKVDANDETWVNADSGDRLILSVGGNAVHSIGAVYAGGSVSSSRTANVSDGSVQTYTLTGNTAFTLTFPSSVWSEMQLILTQDGTGGRVPTFSGVKWAGGVVPTSSALASSTDIYLFASDGTNKYGQVVGKAFA